MMGTMSDVDRCGGAELMFLQRRRKQSRATKQLAHRLRPRGCPPPDGPILKNAHLRSRHRRRDSTKISWAHRPAPGQARHPQEASGGGRGSEAPDGTTNRTGLHSRTILSPSAKAAYGRIRKPRRQRGARGALYRTGRQLAPLNRTTVPIGDIPVCLRVALPPLDLATNL